MERKNISIDEETLKTLNRLQTITLGMTHSKLIRIAVHRLEESLKTIITQELNQ